MAEIKCPVCGEKNPAELEFCQACRSSLRPSSGTEIGFKPGQAPTKKTTADLEPVLPQWLRDARDTARSTMKEESTEPIRPAQETPRIPPSSAPNDLLAGLQAQSQGDDEEEVPDWLASITGAGTSSKKPKEDAGDAGWMDLGVPKDSASESDAPSWLASLSPLQESTPEENELTAWMRESSEATPPQTPNADTNDWLRQMAVDSSFSSDPEPGESFDAPPVISDTPDWLKQMAADVDAKKEDQQPSFAPTPFDTSDTPDWLKQMTADEGVSSFTFPPTDSSDTPDWLKPMAADVSAQNNDTPFPAEPAETSDAPDWFKQMSAADNETQDIGESFNAAPVASDAPDWLSKFSQDEAAPIDTGVSDPSSAITPDAMDWLGALDQPETQQPQSVESAVFTEPVDLESDAPDSSSAASLDWLKGLEPAAPAAAASTEELDWLKGLQQTDTGSGQPAQSDVPVWLSDVAPTDPTSKEESFPNPFAREDVELGDVPGWLKAVAPSSSIFGESSDEPAAETSPASDSSSDWLNAFRAMDDAKPPVFEAGDAVPPAFVSEIGPGENNVDELFTDMPDWLSSSVDVPASSTPITSPSSNTSNVDNLEAGELPSWVQAMRPVDAGDTQLSSSALAADQSIETRGALAGLMGVLPAAPNYAPTSKPKAYSIKLQANDEQQVHAALLEQIVSAETEPVPIASFTALRSSRSLRWALAFLLFVGILSVLTLGTQFFSMPVGKTIEIDSAQRVAQSIPEGAPVLVVFDYEPARVGEMESAAAPFFDEMILLRHPRLSFISTNETGASLAERFMSGPLAGHGYQNGERYLNLGYLPGGSVGINSFALNPAQAAPYAFGQSTEIMNLTLTSAWAQPPLAGVTSLSQFSAFIIITDNADSARAWIEQTTPARGQIPLVVISSAQAAPMLQPYYASKQISGLVGGLYGGAMYKQNSNLAGSARTYWDAFSIGMLLAMALILGGGLWNLALGLRDRAAARKAE